MLYNLRSHSLTNYTFKLLIDNNCFTQAAVIEYARSMLGEHGANSAEFASDLTAPERVVVFMPEGCTDRMGGTMRLGSRTTVLTPGTLAHA
jgi:CTP synthase (UTP-ammonia lyase)